MADSKTDDTAESTAEKVAQRAAEKADALAAEIDEVLAVLREAGLIGDGGSAAGLRRKMRAMLKEGGHGIESRITSEVRDHPVQSLALAGIAGLVLGLLIRR